MEVRPRYKQTEVGVIPDEWSVEPLGRTGRWLSGGTPSMSNRTFWEGEIPWVSAKDMKVPRLHDSQLHVSQSAIGNGTRIAPQSSVLIVVRGMILAHTLPVARAERPVAFNQDLKALVPREGVDSNFLLLWLQSHAAAILGLTSESTHGTKRLTSEDLFAVEVALPKHAEQCVIARAVGDVDALLDALDTLIAKRRDLKQAAMQELLTGRRRLQGFSERWTPVRIGTIAECRAGGTPPTGVSTYWGGNIPWMSSGELHLKMVQDVGGRITDTGLRSCNASLLPSKCVLIGLAGQGKTRGTVAMNLVPLATNQSIAAILPGSGHVPEYLYYNLDSRYEELRDLSSGDGGRGGLSLGLLRDVSVLLPSTAEQVAVAEVLSDMDADLAALEARREKTRALKQAMMQELLTGRIRLV